MGEFFMKYWPVVPVATLSLTILVAADSVSLTVHTDKTTKTVDVRIYGQFLEHIFNSVHGGIWGDQILNGTLELRPANPGGPGQTATPAADPKSPPRSWEFVGDAGAVTNDTANPFNADSSIRMALGDGPHSGAMPGIVQQHIAIKEGENYTLAFYARGNAKLAVDLTSGVNVLLESGVTVANPDWKKYSIEFNGSTENTDASLLISLAGPGANDVNIDQISLFSASALATGGYRPDLLKAIQDLQPATIRWPGGSFANLYIWQNGIGPREKRRPHPLEQWGDRDTYQFGTEEFMALCAKVKAEPIIVINTARGVDDALHWLEYCLGDATTEYGKQRAANGHAAPYPLKMIEVDNEPWLLMKYPAYVDIVNKFGPAIRAKFPNLKLSIAGGYGYDTGPGEGDEAANRNWDPRIITDAVKYMDILSPHYYNGICFPDDFAEDPYKYERYLKERGELLKKTNPNAKIYVSEWNLTTKKYGNDWHVGLYAGSILNAFERQGDMVTMSCPALFMRRQGVTTEWDNALINFDQKSWFPGANYVVMKLWRESYAPNLLAVDGPDHPLNFVAARSTDKQTVFLKAVNNDEKPVEAAVRLEGDLIPKTAAMQLIAPGDTQARNSLEKPDVIKPVAAAATVDGHTIKFTMPPFSASVVRVTP
jgi:alpha-L-arabinofuranosidase